MVSNGWAQIATGVLKGPDYMVSNKKKNVNHSGNYL